MKSSAGGRTQTERALSRVVSALVSPSPGAGPLPAVDLESQFVPKDEGNGAMTINAAFLLAAAGPAHPRSDEAAAHLSRSAESGNPVASFLRDGLGLMKAEVETVAESDPDFAARLAGLAAFLSDRGPDATLDEVAERTWSVFFPEGSGIRGREGARIEELRRHRTIRITGANPQPLTDPGRQVLFTVNLLLTGPPAGRDIDDLDLTDDLKRGLHTSVGERQLFWYDHPVPIGVEPAASELLYGLRAMERGVAFEKRRGAMRPEERLRLVMSISTTHEGLEEIARPYLEREVGTLGLEHVQLYAFGEADTRRLLEEVLVPAARTFLGRDDAASLLGVFGVRGRYGRHHSFGKAVAALWHVLIDRDVVATFKTDLDHSWPQEELVGETERSFLEHFVFPLWGGTGVDRDGRSLELGGMAGALVNEADIHRGLFTTDVPFPDRPPEADELVFWSALPQGLSTLGEASTEYGQRGGPDGVTTALERIHVHAGTVAILVDSLRRHRPFTPSFIGRAEDQAYILSLFGEKEPRLAHVHNRHLIQRHDKKGFAGAAIEASRIPTQIGDYERILLFSAYADALTPDRGALKSVADPFTGGFISRIPVTVTLLRMALRAAALFGKGDLPDGDLLVTLGAERLRETLAFVEGTPSELERLFRSEREGWDLFYDTLTELERRLFEGDATASDLAARARGIIEATRVP